MTHFQNELPFWNHLATNLPYLYQVMTKLATNLVPFLMAAIERAP
jgi:hypothetical protein